MKGQKAYLKASLISGKLYQYPSTLSTSEKSDLYEEYFTLIKKAAYLGHVEGQYDLAQQYEDMSFLGIENPMYNPKKCVLWYTKACDNDHAEACNNLAAFYESGAGCKKDLATALKLYEKSSRLGSPNGRKNHKTMLRDMSPDGKYWGRDVFAD